MLIQQDFGTIYGGGELIVGVEKEVGTFTDGNGVTHKRYIKIVDCGALPNNITKYVDSGITTQITILSIGGVAYSDSYCITLPYISDGRVRILYVIASNQIGISSNSDYSHYTQSYITLEYYK